MFLVAETLLSMLPYRGLGSGIPRDQASWSKIELIEDRAGNQFKTVVLRTDKDKSQPESLENAVLGILAERSAGKAEISGRLGQEKVSGQLNKVIRALLDAGTIEHTILGKPTSRLQKYRIRSK